jgi:hypothetical protein
MLDQMICPKDNSRAQNGHGIDPSHYSSQHSQIFETLKPLVIKANKKEGNRPDTATGARRVKITQKTPSTDSSQWWVDQI